VELDAVLYEPKFFHQKAEETVPAVQIDIWKPRSHLVEAKGSRMPFLCSQEAFQAHGICTKKAVQL